MVYLVSGHPRSGTSMMMQVLEAGGMEAVRNPKRDKFNDQHSDEFYKPNPEGLYELESRQVRRLGFPRGLDGKLIKVVTLNLLYLSVHEYSVIFMTRDPEEIRQSYEAAFGQKIGAPEHIQRWVDEALLLLGNRKDVKQLSIIPYRGFLDTPRPYLESLGWPIDVGKALSVIDPAKCRFRLESLTVGI